MKNLIIFTLLLITVNSVFSQKIVVGVLERAPNNNNRQDYYYTISTGSGSERELKQSMENKLKQNPKYNWMTDFSYAYVGYEGEYRVSIIKYNNKLGIGFGSNETESRDNAVRMIKSIFHLNTTPNYETVYSDDLSGDMNKPPEKPVLISPQSNTTISTTSVELKWSCYDPDNDVLSYEILFGKDGDYLVSIAKDYHLTSFTKTGLLRGEKYNWRVIVTDGKAEKKFSNGSFYTSKINSTNIEKKTNCPVCSGKGEVYVPESYRTCSKCNGTGKIRVRGFNFPQPCKPPLGVCGGTGKVKIAAYWEGCTRCNGTGFLNN